MNWHDVLGDFHKLGKLVDKAKLFIKKEGIPRFYIKTIVKLESSVSSAMAEAKKKLSRETQGSFGSLSLWESHRTLWTMPREEEYKNGPGAW